MKIYEGDYYPPDEWNVTATLTLYNDGQFGYQEHWSSYGGTGGGYARGIWRRSGHTLSFQAEYVEGGLYVYFEIGGERQAVEREDGSIEFAPVFRLSPLRSEPER